MKNEVITKESVNLTQRKTSEVDPTFGRGVTRPSGKGEEAMVRGTKRTGGVEIKEKAKKVKKPETKMAPRVGL